MNRVTGVLMHPRATMAEAVRRPALISTWVTVLMVGLACGVALLSTDVGRQALVDERVRIVEALGGRVDDRAYAAWQARPPVLNYLTSGGRFLLMPPITLLVAVGLVGLSTLDGSRIRYRIALGVTVNASVVLGLQQLVSSPLHYLRESLSSPTNLAGLVPALDQGAWPARLLSGVDLFGLWWVWLLALGLGAATRTPPLRQAWRLVGLYVGIAAVVAAMFAVMGDGGL